jgi:hypothetical protein
LDVNTTAGMPGWENAPSHYKGEGGLQNFDVWDAYEMDAYSANAFKYLARWDKKGSPVNDLKKALHYIQETRNRVYLKGRHTVAVFPGDLIPGRVLNAFDLNGHVAGAVVSLLLYRTMTVNPGEYLEMAEEQVERAIKEAKAGV